ncbi:GIY-YIG nuclease family protein [Nocardia africana]
MVKSTAEKRRKLKYAADVEAGPKLFGGQCSNPSCHEPAAMMFYTSTPLCGNHIAKLFGETQRGIELLTSEAQASKLFPLGADNYPGQCPGCMKRNVLWRLTDGTVRCTNAADGCTFSVDEKTYWQLDRAMMVERAGYEDVVYYAQFRDMVKIGTSSDLHRRLREFPNERLLAFEFGDRKLEAKRHRQFAEFRGVGEWFESHPDIMGHVERLRAA